MRQELCSAVRWYSYVLAYYARQLWRMLPGPLPVKILLIVVCLAIPGPLDELALIAFPAIMHRIRKRKAVRCDEVRHRLV